MYGLIPPHYPSYTYGDLLSFPEGDAIPKFEEALAKYIKCEEVVLTSKGRVALYLILKALGLEKQRILSPAFNCLVVPNTLHYLKCKISYADVSLNDYNIDVQKLAFLPRDTKAIIPTHLYGKPCDIEAVNEWAEKRGIVVIEDAAQSLGASLNGINTGNFGIAGFLSFDLYKNFSTLDGGAVITNDHKLAEKIRELNERLYYPSTLTLAKKWFRGVIFKIISNPIYYYPARSLFFAVKKHYPTFGPGGISKVEKTSLNQLPSCYSHKCSNFQASLGLKQIGKIDKWVEKRRKNAKLYNKLLSSEERIILPSETPECKHVYSRYVVRVEGIRREDILTELRRRGVDAGIWFDYVVHPHPKIRKTLGYTDGTCPNSELASKTVFDLPVYPHLKRKQIYYIADTLKEIVETLKSNQVLHKHP